jgi:hypothetical protein
MQAQGTFDAQMAQFFEWLLVNYASALHHIFSVSVSHCAGDYNVLD